jgi:hypothetical protein
VIIHECTQGSDEWLTLRSGKLTASSAKKVFTPTKGELKDGAIDHIYTLIGECYDPDYIYFAGNKFTDRGNELEPAARKQFTELTGIEVHEVGFVTQDNKVIGASPDGLIKGPDGAWLEGLELKAHNPGKHVEFMHKGVLPPEHRLQVHLSMVVTGLNRWHFLSHHPDMAPFYVITERDSFTEKLEESCKEFITLYQAVWNDVASKLTPNKTK